MADKYNPGMEFQSWTSLPSGGGALGAVAGMWAADKLGLIDLAGMDDEAKDAMRRQGVLGSIVQNKLLGPKAPAGAVAPDLHKQSNYGMQKQDYGFTAPGGQGIRPPASLGVQRQTPAVPNQTVSAYDPENIDHSMDNYLNLFA